MLIYRYSTFGASFLNKLAKKMPSRPSAARIYALKEPANEPRRQDREYNCHAEEYNGIPTLTPLTLRAAADFAYKPSLEIAGLAHGTCMRN